MIFDILVNLALTAYIVDTCFKIGWKLNGGSNRACKTNCD